MRPALNYKTHETFRFNTICSVKRAALHRAARFVSEQNGCSFSFGYQGCFTNNKRYEN